MSNLNILLVLGEIATLWHNSSMAVARIERILKLVNVIQSKQVQNTEDLMDELGVSRRTLFRDLNILKEAGIPCYHDKINGYQIRNDCFLPAINLTVPEALGLMMLSKSALSQRNQPWMEHGLSAINKLATRMPEEIRQVCLDMLSKVSVDAGPVSQVDDSLGTYRMLHRCVDEGRIVRVRYRRPHEDEVGQVLLLKPYLMHYVTRSWYVIAKADAFKEVRVFKLARIIDAEVTQQLFLKPKRYTAKQKFGQAWSMIPEGKIYKVELEFTKMVAMNVAEVRWHSSQKHRILPDGRCRMRFEVDGIGELAWWVCGYAAQVKVIKPRVLAKKVKEMLSFASGQYDKQID